MSLAVFSYADECFKLTDKLLHLPLQFSPCVISGEVPVVDGATAIVR